MKSLSRHSLFSAIGWRLTVLNAALFCTMLIAITGFLYLIEVVTTDEEMTQLLTQTMQRELAEDPIQALKSRQASTDPPHPLFSPASPQAFFVLMNVQGQVRKGTEYIIPGIPNQAALHKVLATGTSDMRDITANGLHLRLYTIPVHEGAGKTLGVLQTYVSLQVRDNELQRILLILLASSATGIVLSAIAARFLAKRALIPIRRAFEQQEHFVADASHELRTPLTLLHADVEVLKRALVPIPSRHAVAASTKGRDKEEVPSTSLQISLVDVELIDEIHTEIVHMNTLITDLLTLAKYDAGMSPVKKQMVFLSPLLTSVVERMTMQATQAQLLIHLLLPNDPRQLIIEGDAAALRRLFLVLMTNAITYTPAGGQIWLQAQAISGRQIEVSVRDTGRGIAADDLPHLFTRFYRADKARTRHSTMADETAPGGTGLGLAIAQTIVESHQGTITASSPGDGWGSTFTVVLKRLL